MILDTLTVLPIPDDRWLERLRRGHFVWLEKEWEFAKIAFAYEPPEPGCCAGSIGIQRLWRHDNDWGMKDIQTWCVKIDGQGFDGSQLIFPVQDNCPDEPLPISEIWQRHVEKTLAQLMHRVEQLEHWQ